MSGSITGRIVVVVLCVCIVIVSLLLYQGASSKPPSGESSIAQKEKTAEPPVKPTESKPEQSPAPAEIRAVIERIYKNAATVDESHANTFTVGDFNGDQSQDIAIIIRPAKGKLPQINEEYANWIIEDPRIMPQLNPDQNAQSSPKRPAPVKVQQHDLLLTIVHGYQQSGWRNPAARQTYLLRNAVGEDIKMEPAIEVLKRTQNGEKLPGLRGDVILETLAGELGFLYWTGAKYSWQKSLAE
jgi:hypothetical protein